MTMSMTQERVASVIKARQRRMDKWVHEPTRQDPKFARCRATSTKLVPGTGNLLARVCVVGEAPGDKEDETGLPFIGPAGTYLSKLLGLAGLVREEIWITNLIKYRPLDGRGLIRRPSPSEQVRGRKYLRRELEVIRPAVVVLCGRVAYEAVVPGRSISADHGRPFTLKIPKRIYYPVMHPAACLRQEAWAKWAEEDFYKLKKLVSG